MHPGLSLGLESVGCEGCSFRREDEVDLPTQTFVQDVQNLAGQRFKYGACGTCRMEVGGACPGKLGAAQAGVARLDQVIGCGTRAIFLGLVRVHRKEYQVNSLG